MIYKAVINIDRSYEDELTEILFAYQAFSVSSEQNGDEILLTAIFEDIDHAEYFLKTNGFTISRMTDEEWKYRWLEGYSGGELTENIYIVPSGNDKIVPSDYKFIVTLDPRDAFGDGRHPTTKQCAVFLEKILNDKDLNHDMALLDAGTGTGILAIVGGLYGLKKIDAIDIEDESVKRTAVNIGQNKMDWINIIKADAMDFNPGFNYDIIIANLLTEVIIKTIDNLKELMTENGILIVSGIGIDWKNEVETLFREKHLIISECSVVDDWCCFKLTK